jgi:sugar transferase (PEP-CTERM/EpsH1 system associated)
LNKDKLLVAHIVYRFDVGGLENGVVNLINHFPEERYRHAIICLTEYTDFFKRINKSDVNIYALHKKQGKDLMFYLRLWKLLRRIKPDFTHTRNIGTIDAGVIAFLAGVKYRVHGEHGRDMYDVDGSNKKYQKLRRLCSPFINKFIALSKDLETWLLDDVHISPDKVIQLYNGVDTEKFSLADKRRNEDLLPSHWRDISERVVFGTVGRMEPIKDQLTLVSAFSVMIEKSPGAREKARLVLVGDGQLKEQCEKIAEDNGIADLVWFAGKRNDVANLLNIMDCFVLPSRAEGISNTILESMSCSLPVIATAVGGNVELVEDATTGYLVPAEQPESMAEAMANYIVDSKLRQRHGEAGRARVEKMFSMKAMISKYKEIYDSLSLS